MNASYALALRRLIMSSSLPTCCFFTVVSCKYYAKAIRLAEFLLARFDFPLPSSALPFPFSSIFISLPFPFPVVSFSQIQVRSLGSTVSSPAQSGQPQMHFDAFRLELSKYIVCQKCTSLCAMQITVFCWFDKWKKSQHLEKIWTS